MPISTHISQMYLLCFYKDMGVAETRGVELEDEEQQEDGIYILPS